MHYLHVTSSITLLAKLVAQAIKRLLPDILYKSLKIFSSQIHLITSLNPKFSFIMAPAEIGSVKLPKKRIAVMTSGGDSPVEPRAAQKSGMQGPPGSLF